MKKKRSQLVEEPLLLGVYHPLNIFHKTVYESSVQSQDGAHLELEDLVEEGLHDLRRLFIVDHDGFRVGKALASCLLSSVGGPDGLQTT